SSSASSSCPPSGSGASSRATRTPSSGIAPTALSARTARRGSARRGRGYLNEHGLVQWAGAGGEAQIGVSVGMPPGGSVPAAEERVVVNVGTARDEHVGGIAGGLGEARAGYRTGFQKAGVYRHRANEREVHPQAEHLVQAGITVDRELLRQGRTAFACIGRAP